MLQRPDEQREILDTRLAGMPLRISHIRPAICQESCKPVARDYEQAKIDLATYDRAPKVDEIYDYQVASGRELHLDSHTHSRALDSSTLRPIDVTRLFLGPTASSLEAFVDQPADRCTAIRVLLFLHAKLKIGQDAPNLTK